MSIARVNIAVSEDIFSSLTKVVSERSTTVSGLVRSAIEDGVAKRLCNTGACPPCACSKCGGARSRIIRSEYRPGRIPFRTRECTDPECGHRWTEPTSRKRKQRVHRPAKLALVCPECGSTNTRVTGSRDFPVRNHKCHNPGCGYAFTSVAEVIKGEPL